MVDYRIELRYYCESISGSFVLSDRLAAFLNNCRSIERSVVVSLTSAVFDALGPARTRDISLRVVIMSRGTPARGSSGNRQKSQRKSVAARFTSLKH